MTLGKYRPAKGFGRFNIRSHKVAYAPWPNTRQLWVVIVGMTPLIVHRFRKGMYDEK